MLIGMAPILALVEEWTGLHVPHGLLIRRCTRSATDSGILTVLYTRLPGRWRLKITTPDSRRNRRRTNSSITCQIFATSPIEYLLLLNVAERVGFVRLRAYDATARLLPCR